MDNFLIGMIAMALVTAGLFFLRFWRDTGDRLFLIFAIAFWLLALTRCTLIAVAYTSGPSDRPLPARERPVAEQTDEGIAAALEEEVKKEIEQYVFVYWVRLAAFLLILIAIIDKNLTRRDRPGHTT